MKRIIFLLSTIVLLSACAPAAPAETEQTVDDPLGMKQASTVQLTSTAFEYGQPIPAQYACQDPGVIDKDVSPPLAWGEPPAGTQSFALIMDDPDAPGGTWDHWVLFNLAASARGLPESVPVNATLAGGGAGGSNSWGTTGYGGPCPPAGRIVISSDSTPWMKCSASSGASRGELEKAMVGHILAHGRVDGHLHPMTVSNSIIQRALKSGNPSSTGDRATFIWRGSPRLNSSATSTTGAIIPDGSNASLPN
jgi:Raf kinase inhibitor-like YbhB/YbcL family protein